MLIGATAWFDADANLHFWAYFGSRRTCPTWLMKNEELPALILVRHRFGGLAGLTLIP
jgi:hypothetical protein